MTCVANHAEVVDWQGFRMVKVSVDEDSPDCMYIFRNTAHEWQHSTWLNKVQNRNWSR